MATSAAYHLDGDLGTLLVLNGVALPTADSITRLPKVVVVVDNSGSMGAFSDNIVKGVVPACLKALKYPDDTIVTFILFDTYTRRIDCRLVDAKDLDMPYQGCTRMSDIFPVLAKVFRSTPDTDPISIIAVSDGHIDDAAATVLAAQRLACDDACALRKAPVSVSLIRLVTNTHSEPDTRALACLGILDTSSNHVAVCTVDVKGNAQVLSDLAKAMQTGLQFGCMGVSGVLSAPTPCMKRMPGDVGTSHLAVPMGQSSFVLLDPGSTVSGLMLNGVPFKVATMDLGANKDVLIAYLTHVETQLRMWAVSGAKDLGSALAWVSRLPPLLGAVVRTSGSMSVRDRAASILEKIRVAKATVVQRILALGNRGKLAALNSAQLASFLTGGVVSTALARRVTKHVDLDFDASCRAALQSLNVHPVSEAALSDLAATSFYSLDTWPESLASAQLLSVAINDVGAEDLLTVLGGLGVAFYCTQGDYPDPWTFRVDRVFLGAYVNEADLRSANTKGVLAFPGVPGSVINGVLPLMSLCPVSAVTYNKSCRVVADFHASISMRGNIAPVPGDRIAMAAAVLFALVDDFGPTRPLTLLETDTLHAVRSNLMGLLSGYSLEPLSSNLCLPDARPWLTGDLDVSALLKPFAALMAAPQTAGLRASPSKFTVALQALYEFAAYRNAKHVVRSMEARTAALHELLGIELGMCPPPGQPFTCPPLDYLHAVSRLSMLPWLPNVATFQAMARFGLDITPTDPVDVCSDHQALRLAAAVSALLCIKDSDRVDPHTRTSLTWSLGVDNAVSLQEYVVAAAADIWQAEYNRLVDLKETADYYKRAMAVAHFD
jgi:hypothetical protein